MTNTEALPPGVTQLRYIVALRPCENIDADWQRVGFNDRPVLGESVWFQGQEYKIASYRAN